MDAKPASSGIAKQEGYFDHYFDQPPKIPSNDQKNAGTQPQPPVKPTVIGIYGIPGSGKSFILKALREQLGWVDFTFFEGSHVIAQLVPGGLEAFRRLDDDEKWKLRTQAIHADSEDLKTFTHIIYLHTLPQTIFQRISKDTRRTREILLVDTLATWQDKEISPLRDLCRQYVILFLTVSKDENVISTVQNLVQHFRKPCTPEANMARVRDRLDETFDFRDKNLETALVMDGDRTLTPEDTSALFWEQIVPIQAVPKDPLKALFGGPMGYSDAAFHQAMLLYEEVCGNNEKFDTICQIVASSVSLYPEFVAVLRLAAENKHVGAAVVTCGLGRIWTKVLERYGLSDTVKVIGGGRISDGFIVTPAVKAAIVSQLKVSNLLVVAFGDSPLDIPMLEKADRAIVVVGEEKTRSSTMDAALSKAIDGGLRSQQILLPRNTPYRLNKDRLPVVSMQDNELTYEILGLSSLAILRATRQAAMLLMAPMRDARVRGPALRDAHVNAGRYLALECIPRIIHLGYYDVPHVQGHMTNAHRLRNEQRTSIVAMMRGGEPMAIGINEVFPRAMFIHASSVDDIKSHHLENQANIILVDSVVNTGKSMIEFLDHVGGLLKTDVRIVVAVGVVQAETTSHIHPFARAMKRHGAQMVALRVSENKFTGTKGTDTGNRLFNTTHLA